MPIIATEGEKFTPAPAGAHQAVCVDVVDLGKLEVNYGGKSKTQHKIRIVWQIDQLNDDGKPFIVQKRYTLSLSDMATLRHDLESWRGRAFTSEELRGFDVENVVGANCQINIVHETKNGTTYANVTAVMPLGRGMGKMQPTNYTRVKDRPKDGQSQQEESSAITDSDIPF